MPRPRTLDDDALLAGFTAGTLRSFSHDDHVRVAWLLCTRSADSAAALDAMTSGIRSMAESRGLSDKFHATRTAAWLALVDAASDPAATPGGDSHEFLAQHPELLDRAALDAHYSTEVLNSDAARRAFVAPDLAPLPVSGRGGER
ncbi:hypothetical protein GCM10022200_01140 [Microbacterium awajiense]|uniref:Uncharacterized protein n=1 Tax=Microbacterium awajiense TaxID=415214 RepID=A0ABP6ZYL3_9MICO